MCQCSCLVSQASGSHIKKITALIWFLGLLFEWQPFCFILCPAVTFHRGYRICYVLSLGTLSWKNVTTGWLSPHSSVKKLTDNLLHAGSQKPISLLIQMRFIPPAQVLCSTEIFPALAETLFSARLWNCHIPLWSQAAYRELFSRRWASRFCFSSSSPGAYTLHPELSPSFPYDTGTQVDHDNASSLAYPRTHPRTLWSLASSSPSPEQWETPLALQP